jgi:hypothetical protein
MKMDGNVRSVCGWGAYGPVRRIVCPPLHLAALWVACTAGRSTHALSCSGCCSRALTLVIEASRLTDRLNDTNWSTRLQTSFTASPVQLRYIDTLAIVSMTRDNFFLFNSNNYTIYPSDMDNKYIFCLIYSNGKIYITW